jgi:hypothetical protein
MITLFFKNINENIEPSIQTIRLKVYQKYSVNYISIIQWVPTHILKLQDF